MNRKNVSLKISELESDIGNIHNLELTIGKISGEDWSEAEGPTPFPMLTSLRSWDHKLLARYQPFYLPFCDLCCFCTFGKCDLTGTKRGACGITMPAQQSRFVLLAACIGAATHISHARELVTHAILTCGADLQLDPGGNSIDIEAPVTRLVCGVKPEKLSDLETVLDYLEGQVTQLLAVAHTGQEGSSVDFESKVLHAGMIDQVGLEVADLAQTSALGFPKAEPDTPLVNLGMGGIDTKKPVILVIGHNVPPAVHIVEYLRKNRIPDAVEVTGICCTALDVTRYSSSAKIVGPMSWQLRYIRSGIPDVVVVDEQCIRTDTLLEARAAGSPFIATSDKNCMGLPDRTLDPPDQIIADLTSGREAGVLILDPMKAGEVAVRVAQYVAPLRKKPTIPLTNEQIVELAKTCTQCKICRRSCPNDLHIPESMKGAGKGKLAMIGEMYEECLGCGRCEQACTQHIPIHTMITAAAAETVAAETFCVRTGRGAIQDVEIRTVGGPIVLGEIPGVVAFVGCSNYPKGGREVAEMCMEFAKRRYINMTSGCAAISIGMYKNEDGKTPYEIYPGTFDAGGIVNVGSCVANAHIAGAAIKIASIFAKRTLRGNYEEIADYVYNRVGAVGVAWGAMSQKAVAIAAGFWRLGIPVVVGPHGTKYRRMLLGKAEREQDWYVYDRRTGESVYVGPVPEHLFFAAETKEEAMVMIAKLCMRPNDTTRGRAIKLTHYLDLHKRMMGVLPDDIDLFVRSPADIPVTMKSEVMDILRKRNWKEHPIPDPTLLVSQIRKPAGGK